MRNMRMPSVSVSQHNQSRSHPFGMLILYCLWICSLIGLLSGAASADTLSFSAIQDPENLARRYHLWEDVDRTATLETLPPADSAEWQHNSAGLTNFGLTHSAYWLRLSLSDLKQLRSEVYIRLNYPHLDEIDFYLLSDGQVLKHLATGDTRPFASRETQHRTYLLPLSADMPDSIDVVIRVASQGPMMLPLDLVSQVSLLKSERPLYTWFGVYFGVLAMVFLYNLLIYLSVRDNGYLYYLGYVAAVAALQISLNGFGFQYIWPASGTLNNTMILLTTGFLPVAAITFVMKFINLSKVGDRGDNILSWLLLSSFGLVLLGVFVSSYGTILKLAQALSAAAVVYGFYIGVKYWWRGLKAARTFALAWFVYLIFIAQFLLDVSGVIQPSILSSHGLEIGSLFEIALLSLAFADRLNAEKELRLNAQLELNQNLDNLVRERTKELEQAYQKLKEISNTDGLTGLCNRRHFDELYLLEFQRAYRDQIPIALMMLDVDHFKRINDTYGHFVGDICLKQVADVLQNVLRRPSDLVARYGGEEFIVLLPATAPQEAHLIAESIRAAIEAHIVLDRQQTIQLTVSIGVMSACPSARDQHKMFQKQADTMLYQAKHGGRNQVKVADRLEVEGSI
ncbi:MAG: GGDEF domain-containing protein [Hahellaceae bacterium]|nr:GGDEF domain-containing protein [Hahellaceae bacterium]